MASATMRGLPLLLGFAFPPAGSFLVQPARLLDSSLTMMLPGRCHVAGQANVPAMTARRTGSERPPTFPSDEAVSYYFKPESGCRVYLVGVIHNSRQSSKLVERVIRKVRPHVVMVEVDAYRIRLLPPGAAAKDEEGLCWWSPLDSSGGDPVSTDNSPCKDGGVASSDSHDSGLEAVAKKKSLHRNRQSRMAEGGDRRGQAAEERACCEFDTAARSAMACGARVLLGDRDFEETERRLAAAERADSEDPPPRRRQKQSGEKGEVAARIRRRGLEGTTPAVWRKMREVEKSWKPRKFAVLMTERDEVMANNLLKLEGVSNTAIVAVVGAHHTVGIGCILETNDWKTRRR